MERCECLPLNSKFTRKSVLVKTKPFNGQIVTSVNQLFKVLSTGHSPLPWLRRLYAFISNPIQSNPMSIMEAGQGPLFPSLSKNLTQNTVRNGLSMSSKVDFGTNQKRVV